MRTIGVMAVIGLGLIGAVGTASAQSWGPDYGYRDRDREYRSRDGDYRDRDYRDRGYRDRSEDYGRRDEYRRDRDYGSRDRDRDYRDRDREAPRGAAAFNEREYLRCNPDVARAVLAGKMESGYKHFQVHGFREGRKLSC